MQPSALRTLCELYTELTTEDISRLEGLESQISVVAELTETDIFIDALTHNGIDAIVLDEDGLVALHRLTLERASRSMS
jgi:hypothetical protein